MRARTHWRRGGNAIEFALTLPIYVMIMVGLMEYGYLFAMQAGLDNATSIACREGAMMDPAKGAGLPSATAVSNFGSRSALFCGGGVCTFNAYDEGAAPDRTLHCEVSRPMNSLIGFLPSSMYPSSIRSVSYYRFEWQRPPPPPAP